MNMCTLYSKFCSTHNFVHGAEAEELRSGIEEIIESNPSEDEWEWELRRLLDMVDARDSLAYLEAKNSEQGDD
jgi:hypothetical protein